MLTGGRHQAVVAGFARAAALLAMATLVLGTALFGTAGATASAATTHGAGGIGSWPWPVVGEVVGEYRNGSDPYAAGQHRGVDIAAPAGTPARAVVAGTVSFSGKLPDGGQTVTIRSADGRHLVSYLHLSRRDANRGSRVAIGESVGLTGTTGRRSVPQPHLHLGVRIAATRSYVDPMTLLGPQKLAEPLRAPAPSAPAENRTEPSARRVASGKLPRIEPLEKPHANRAGMNESASPHVTSNGSKSISGRRAPRVADARAAVKAPPPLEEAAVEAKPVIEADPPISETAEPSDAPTADRGQSIPLRPLLLALTAFALIALVFNRRTRPNEASPTEPLAPTATAEGNELPEDRPLLRSVK